MKALIELSRSVDWYLHRKTHRFVERYKRTLFFLYYSIIVIFACYFLFWMVLYIIAKAERM